jgi:RHS repeat-associated protein
MVFYPWGNVWQTWGGGGYNFAKLPYRDVTTNTDITPARFSSPNFGRWFSPDPIGKAAVQLGDPQTWNMYAYVRNNPTTLTDPNGSCWFCDFISRSWVAINNVVTMPDPPGKVTVEITVGHRIADPAVAAQEQQSQNTAQMDSNGNLTLRLGVPGPPALVDYEANTVTDASVTKVLSEISVYFASSTVYVTSGDRDYVPDGGAKNSAHPTGQAADFHVMGQTDSKVDEALKHSGSPVSTGFRVIQHGTDTATQGAHIHLDSRNEPGQPTIFMHEGMAPQQAGVYSNDRN